MEDKKINDKLKDILCIALLLITYLIIVIVITNNGKYILGSNVDFSMQHYTIPEYFRKLFYQTHDLFPDFAFNLGAGENIYYLSYYGFLNPIILISYLFPHITMLKFIIISMTIVVLSSSILLYYYFKKNNYSKLTSFLCAFLFLCSAPLIYHSHRHIMFVNYFPFLILGFYGIDKYIKDKKNFLLITSITLMIFTSYYYSVSGIIVLLIYAIYKYVKEFDYNFKDITKFLFSLIFHILTSILISSILIIPTLYTLLSGRTNDTSIINFIELLKPNMYMLYNSYSMGLTLICLIASIYMIFTRKKENIFLGIIILLVSIFPVFNYILNGFLYINAKSLIPFIILVLINTADFFTIIFQKIKPITKYLLTFYIIASSFVVCITCNLQDSLISKDKINYDFYQNYENYVNKIAYDNLYRTNTSFLDKIYINKVGNTKEYKTTIYSSTYNKEYQDSYKNIFHNPLPYRNKFMISSSNNLLFQIYMGEKYIYTKKDYDNIYEKIYGSKDINIYKNNYVLPIGYSTAKVINEKDYENLSYPDSVINILGKVVNKEKTNTEIINTSKINLDYKIEDIKNMSYKETEYGYYVDVSKNAKLTLKLNNDLKDKILFISFDILENVSCKNNNDLAIKINDVKNKLTCMEWKYNNQNTNFNYTLFDFKDNTLNITLEKGIYKIGNIKISTLDFNYLKNLNDNIDPFIIDKDKTIGDKIVGSISVTEDAYFNLSIPYDKGFTILVDKEEVDYYKINNSFIGFDISKGNHEIEIIYHAPYKDISKIFSLIGVVLYVIALFIEKKLEIDSSNLL